MTCPIVLQSTLRGRPLHSTLSWSSLIGRQGCLDIQGKLFFPRLSFPLVENDVMELSDWSSRLSRHSVQRGQWCMPRPLIALYKHCPEPLSPHSLFQLTFFDLSLSLPFSISFKLTSHRNSTSPSWPPPPILTCRATKDGTTLV